MLKSISLFRWFWLAMLATFFGFRLYLYYSPNTNLDVLGYNLHHLFTGLLIFIAAGFPLMFFKVSIKSARLLAIIAGVGMGLVLDEWVYLIATDGSDSAYLTPVSFWGGLIMVLLAICYLEISAKFLKIK